MKKIKINKRIIVITVITGIVLAIVAFFWLFPVKKVNEYTTVKAKKIDLVQTVSEVGSVKASKEIKLSFGQSGRLEKLYSQVGDRVKKGQLLAELDHDSLVIQKQEAQSNLEAARANLAKIRSGASREEIDVAEAQAEAARKKYISAQDTLKKTKDKVNESIAQAKKRLNDLESDEPNNITTEEQSVISAENDLKSAKSTYQKSIENKEASLKTAIDSKLSVANTALDEIDNIINNDDIKNGLGSKNTSYLTETEDAYKEAESLLDQANSSLLLAKEKETDTALEEAADDCLQALDSVFSALNLCFKVLEYSSLSQTEEDTYKATINGEITTISSGISSVETAIQALEDAHLAYETNVSSAQEAVDRARVALKDAITAAKNSLSTARKSGEKEIAAAEANVSSAKESWEVSKKQLNKLKAPPRREDVDLYRSKVKQAKASLDLIEQRIEDSRIKSPIDGKIVSSEHEAGEQVSPSVPIMSVLAEGDFEIEVDISESDIAKVDIGDPAEITLDAFGQDRVFEASVTFVEPAETVIQDVIYYKVKLMFNEALKDLKGVKSGMTANIDIRTNIKKGVLAVPARAIVEKNDNEYIKVWKNGKTEEHKVEVGLRGDEGLLEVFDHIEAGDEVVTYTKEVKKRVFRY